LTGQIADLDYTGEHVYISIPCRGLYRTSTKIVTGVRSVVFPVASTPRLDVFPNPGDTEMTIRWEGFDQDGGVTVEIFDVLGRAVKRIETASTAGVVHWDCTGATGASVMPGLYFARLTDGVNVATENVLIIR
jgi:flagellar hook assembly protein FlgD